MTVTIERVEVVCLQDPQAPYYRFEGSYRNVVVIAQGDNGLTGIGESDAPPEIVKAAIEMAPYNHLAEGLGAIVTGQAVDDPPRLWDEMYSRTQWFGRRGAAICAISALDIAIWDLFAQSKGVPVCEALGGARHARLPAYATIYPLESELAGIDAQVAPLLEQGFRHLKVCVEPWWAEPARVRRNLTHLRDLVGQDRHLMLDVAQEFTRLEQLAPYLDLLADLDFAWIEAPFPLDDVEEHARLRAATTIPIGVGDLGLTTCKEFEPFLAADAFDIAQPDLTDVRRLHRGAAARADAGRHRPAHRAPRLQHRHHHRGQSSLLGHAAGDGPGRVFDEFVTPAAGPRSRPPAGRRGWDDPGA